MKYKKFFLIIFVLIFYSCHFNKQNNIINIKNAIPVNSDVIFKVHNWKKIETKVESFEWWKELKNTKQFKENINLLKNLNHQYQISTLFNSREIYLSAILDINKQAEIILITSISDIEQNRNTNLVRVLKSNQNKSYLYEGVEINIIEIDTDEETKKDIFISSYNNVFLLSFSKIIIEESIRQLIHNNNIFQHNSIYKLDQNLPKYSDVNILVKTQFLEKLIDEKNILLNSNSWSWFDVELENNHILLNGVTNRGDNKYLENSKYSDAKRSKVQDLIPRHIGRFYNYQIKNNYDLNNILSIINKNTTINNYQLLHNSWQAEEICVAYNKSEPTKKDYIIIKVNKIKESLEFLTSHHEDNFTTIKYFDYNINKINSDELSTENWLKKLINPWSEKYYINFQNYIIICNNSKELKSMINNIIAKQTIGQSKAIQIIDKKLGTKSHTSTYINFNNLEKNWKQIFNSVVVKNIASQDYFFNSLFFLYDYSKISNPTIWNFNLKNETNYTPQIVTNHYTQKFEIFTQDIENNIYLIDSKGKQIWIKQIGNSIIGEIHQIDIFNNNKLQYLFNTKDSIYAIDRNGNYVKPFPIKSKNPMSVPLALFDYDNNKNYRILVPMQNELVMYDKKGNVVSGWEFNSSKSNISTSPEHFQIFNKDYIVINEENGKIHLLNRKGQKRTDVKQKIYKSKLRPSLIKGNSINDSKLIIKEKNGKMTYLYFNGLTDSLKIQNMKEGDFYEKNENYTIVINNSKVVYESKENQFEYNFKNSKLSAPKIFFQNDSLLLAIQNQSENLIYLLNQNGDLQTKPFYGSTDFNIVKVNSNINMIVGSYEGVLYNYKIN